MFITSDRMFRSFSSDKDLCKVSLHATKLISVNGYHGINRSLEVNRNVRSTTHSHITLVKYCHVFGVLWLIIMVLVWMIGFIDTHLHSSGLQAITALSIFYTLAVHRCTLTTTLSFTSRILETDLSQSHCHFNSRTTSSWHSLILFMPFSAADKSEDSTQFSSDWCSVLLQLLAWVWVWVLCYDRRSVGQSVLV
jgi:hypothetical protein